jgi:hypothetical protein
MSEPTPIEAARFPRAAIILQMTAVCAVLRAAADALEALAAESHAYELGSLRRKARGVILGALAFAEGSTGDEP